ncbi:hypothetical protein L579_0704 [Pantoea sp. AS-PWVM4]|nr:hypothetical protein L579_0704 [Pantoea sp. AS-PWVM4]
MYEIFVSDYAKNAQQNTHKKDNFLIIRQHQGKCMWNCIR